MHLTIFIATFLVLLIALCCFIPYIGIVAIFLTLFLAFCIGALGVVAKMRFVWISCIVAAVTSLIALPFQISYAIQGALRLGEALVEHGHITWAQSIAPKLISISDSIASEMKPQAEHYQALVHRVAASRQLALDLGATEAEANEQALLTFHQLVKEEHIHFNCGPECSHGSPTPAPAPTTPVSPEPCSSNCGHESCTHQH